MVRTSEIETRNSDKTLLIVHSNQMTKTYCYVLTTSKISHEKEKLVSDFN